MDYLFNDAGIVEEIKRMPMGSKVLLIARMALLMMMAFFILFGKYPPARAQSPSRQVVPVLTVEDAMQDEHIAELNRHVESADDRFEKWKKEISDFVHELGSKQQADERDISSAMTELRLVEGGAGGTILIQIGASLGASLRRKKVD